MPLQTDPSQFALPPELAAGVAGKRVFITGAGRDKGLGQAFALAAGLNGASGVAVHFHNSYEDGLDTVNMLRDHGCENAFPVQCDVTNPRDVWSIRSYVIQRLGGVPDVVICNSGASEAGYMLGRVPRELEGESSARRRARVRQAFVENLAESQMVIDTKVDGFLAMTHLWASEAVHAKQPLTIVYISSRQAVDPGPAVPGYVMANWAVLSLPKILHTNLGRSASLVKAFSVGYPFVKTSMTEEYADNPKVFGRWQARMLEPYEAAKTLMQILSRPGEELDERFFQLLVDAAPELGEGGIRTRWAEIGITIEDRALGWSDEAPLEMPAR
ncbi:MAG: SDR family oxidoreductase [Deltaproteobacteria bacterium]|nr:MAG: SDR family oxidoreductase [Deltaproteobacteria bacterium]